MIPAGAASSVSSFMLQSAPSMHAVAPDTLGIALQQAQRATDQPPRPKTNGERKRAIVDAVDAELNEIAQALHDTVCQGMSGAQLLATVLFRKLEKGAAESAASAAADLLEVLRDTITEVQAIIRTLRRNEQGSAGLREALAEFARDTSRKIPCDFQCVGEPRSPDRYVTLQIMRIANAITGQVICMEEVSRIAICLAADAEQNLAMNVSWDLPGKASRTVDRSQTSPWALVRLRAQVIGAQLKIGSRSVSLKLPRTATD
jgi:signal transduction histidine kinase